MIVVDDKIICRGKSLLAGSVNLKVLNYSIDNNMSIYTTDCNNVIKYIINPIDAASILDIIGDNILWIGERASGNNEGIVVRKGYRDYLGD